MFLSPLVLIDLFDNDYSYIVFSKIFVNLHLHQITCKRSVLVAFAARVQSATNTDIHVIGFSRSLRFYNFLYNVILFCNTDFKVRPFHTQTAKQYVVNLL